VDILSVVLRALSFVLQLQAAGAAFFAAAFGPALTISLSSVRSAARIAATAAFFVAAAHYVLETARMAGDMSGIFDSSLQSMAWNSSTGGAFSVRELGLLLIIAGMQTTSVRMTAERFFKSSTAMSPGFWLKRLSSRGFTIAGVGGAVLVAASFTLTGHTSISGWRWILVPLLLAHLLIVAFWFGSLGPLYLVTLRESRERAARAVTLFSAAAVWLVPLILVAGVAIAVLLLPSVAALWHPYGLFVIAKGCLFAVLLGLAAFNKWRFGPALGNGDLSAGRVFRRMVIVEYVLIIVVLSATAVMTTFFSPE
ncbi:MAG TPA: CopD family protein, partial [Steroidobacteraceae bacterium]